MATLRYDEYLTESKLVSLIQNLCERLERCEFLGVQFCFPESKRYKYDVAFECDGLKYLVEFDGYQHYTNPFAIFRDCKKTELALAHGFILVRIPYFVQLTNDTFKHYFPSIQNSVSISSSFPHGFISDTNFYPPASFCSLGSERYKKELQALPSYVRRDIQLSLERKAEELNVPLLFVDIQ